MATRFLARSLGISRNTVTDAYDMMVAEGLISSYPGKGSFVLERSPEKAAPSHSSGVNLSERAENLVGYHSDCSLPLSNRVFEPGIPALDRFPLDRWRRCFSTAVARLGHGALCHEDPRGSKELWSVIAAHIVARDFHLTC